MNIVYNVRKGTKIYYDILVENGSKPRCCKKLNIKLSKDINWDTTFYKILKKMHEVKLKWFQIRLVHRILATNTMLKRMKISNDEKCTHTLRTFHFLLGM